MSLPEPYYQDDHATIYHGDCLELLSHIEADVVVTDPPWGVGFSGKATKHKVASVGYDEFEDSPENVIANVVPIVAQEVNRRDRVCVLPGVRMMYEYPKPTHTGSIFEARGAGMNSWGFSCWQPILYYGKCPFLANGRGSRPDSFQPSGSGATSADNGHPCPKPIQVMTWMVKRVSNEGELVLDPFMGSGTTLRAAKDLGRKSIGIEISEQYCEIAANRLAQEVLDFGGAAA